MATPVPNSVNSSLIISNIINNLINNIRIGAIKIKEEEVLVPMLEIIDLGHPINIGTRVDQDNLEMILRWLI